MLDAADIARLRSLSYGDYLRSAWWRCRRYEALDWADWRCQDCGQRGVKDPYGVYGLEVHHRSYENLGCEKAEDLVVLCRGCHRKAHSPAGTHKIKIDLILERV